MFVSLARGWYRYIWCNLDDKESASNDKFSMTGPVKKPGAVVLGKLLSQETFLPV